MTPRTLTFLVLAMTALTIRPAEARQQALVRNHHAFAHHPDADASPYGNPEKVKAAHQANGRLNTVQNPQLTSSSYVPPRTVSFTSTRVPSVSVGRQYGPEQLYYDYASASYWIVGAQSMRSVSVEQADEFRRTHPIRTWHSWDTPQQILQTSAASPDAAGASGGPGEMIDNTAQEPGWADYDDDGIIDEVFPLEKTRSATDASTPQYELKPGDPVP